MEDSILIKALEFGEKTGLQGTTWPLFEKWAADNHFIESKGTEKSDVLALKTIFKTCFEEIKAQAPPHSLWVLKPEYYFKLIEYRELKRTGQTAGNAGKNAYKAILLAVLAILFSLIMGMTRPVSINPDDLNALILSNQRQKIQEVEINRLQMAQLLSALESQPSQPVRKPARQHPSNEDSMLDAINRYYEQQ